MTVPNKAKIRRRAIVLIAAAIMWYGSGIANVFVNQSLDPRQCVMLVCLTVGVIATGVLSFVGLVLAIWAGFGILRGITDEYTIHRPSTSKSETGSSPEDAIILEIANNVLTQLKVRRIRSLESVLWSPDRVWYWASTKQKSLRRPTILVLPAYLRGRLEPGEWRILLQYQFIQSIPPVRPILRLFVPMIGFILLMVVAAAVSANYGIQAGRIFGAAFLSPLSLLVVVLTFSYAKQTFLSQDKSIARNLGKDRLLGLFRKIDSLAIPEVEIGKKREGWVNRYWPVPNITERLANLERIV